MAFLIRFVHAFTFLFHLRQVMFKRFMLNILNLIFSCTIWALLVGRMMTYRLYIFEVIFIHPYAIHTLSIGSMVAMLFFNFLISKGFGMLLSWTH